MAGALNVVRKFFPKVERVVDAHTGAAIEVTKADASSKAVKDHSACAMAVACQRKFKLDGVIISRSVAYLIKGKQARRFMLPPSIEREITSFDRGGGFAVGSYALSAVPPHTRLDYKRANSNRSRGARGTKPKRHRHITTNVRSVLGGQEPEE